MVDEVKTTLGPGVTVAAWEIPELKVSAGGEVLSRIWQYSWDANRTNTDQLCQIGDYVQSGYYRLAKGSMDKALLLSRAHLPHNRLQLPAFVHT
jgi:hypothetical protein